MKTPRIDIGSIRREQIVEAAVAVIAEQGLQNLSLSEIEQKAGMSRGQLTYYFPTKEAILLAVFDRVLLLMYQRVGTPGGKEGDAAGGWDWVRHLLQRLISQPPVSPAFSCLQYTFLAQIAHREDFRARLARLYEEWRGNMAQGLAADRPRARRPWSPRTLASLVQAILHGLAMQTAADPSAFDRDEMLALCLDVLGEHLRTDRRRTRRKAAPGKTPGSNGSHAGRRALPRAAARGGKP